MKKVILLVFLFALDITTYAQSASGNNPYLSYIAKYGQKPTDYIADKIRTHSVVTIGEDHWIKDHPLFLCDVIGATATDTTANIDILALEFGSYRDQQLVNELLDSPEYREDLVFKILQQTPDIYGNPYKEYADVFRTVWETNRIKQKEYRTQILLLDPSYIQEAFDNKKYLYTCSRDEQMFNLIREYVMQRKHVVLYAGAAHTQAQIRGVRDESYYYNFPSAGYLLKKCYPKDVFIINLWGAYMGAQGYEPNDKTRWVQLAGGIIDEAFRLNGNKPIGFDLGGAFSHLTTGDYYRNPDGTSSWDEHPTDGSPYADNLLMRDRCDGIVFIKPTEELSGMHLINIYDNKFLKRIKKRSEGECRTPQQTLQKIKEWHPIVEL